MAKHQIKQAFWHKGWVFLFSIVHPYGLWSTHETGDTENLGGNHYAKRFQDEHDQQIDGLYAKAEQEDQLKIQAEGVQIDDRTEESREILKQRN